MYLRKILGDPSWEGPYWPQDTERGNIDLVESKLGFMSLLFLSIWK